MQPVAEDRRFGPPLLPDVVSRRFHSEPRAFTSSGTGSGSRADCQEPVACCPPTPNRKPSSEPGIPCATVAQGVDSTGAGWVILWVGFFFRSGLPHNRQHFSPFSFRRSILSSRRHSGEQKQEPRLTRSCGIGTLSRRQNRSNISLTYQRFAFWWLIALNAPKSATSMFVSLWPSFST